MSIYAEVVPEVCKLTPPVAVTNAVVMGITMNDWLTMLTFIYVIMLILEHIGKQIKKNVEQDRKQIENNVDLDSAVKRNDSK